MRLNASRTYSIIFTVILLLQLYQPSFKINILLQLFTIGLLLVTGGTYTGKKFVGHLGALIFLLVWGFLGTLLHKYDIVHISKDVFHFLKPIFGLVIGYLVFREVNDVQKFVKVVIITGFISALIHIYILMFMVDFSAGELSDIRYFTKDNFLELFAIFFIIFHKKYFGRPVFNNGYFRLLVLTVIIISSVFYFSRTMVIMAALLLLAIYGYTRITKTTIIAAAMGVLALAGLYTYLYNANIRRGKPGLEGFLYKIKMAPGEIFNGKINRDDHRQLWDHWRAYEAGRALALMDENPSSYLLGTGHGSAINLKFYVQVGDEEKGMRYISQIHNGYIYVFYKTGAVGLLIYLLLLMRWYAYIFKRRTFINVLISAIGIIYLFTSLTITGLYNARDVLIFILGGALFFATQNTTTAKQLSDET